MRGGVVAIAALAACGRIGFEPEAAAVTLWIAPDGDDAAPGSQDAPFLTWSHALAQLAPGYVLVARAGKYRPAVNGHLVIWCNPTDTACAGRPCASGLPDAPITVRAEHERTAALVGDGTSGNLATIDGCAHWTLRGLTARDPFPAHNVLRVVASQDITIERWLMVGSDIDAVQARVTSSADVALIENEHYEYALTAIYIDHTRDAVVRRVYANARGRGAGSQTFPCPAPRSAGGIHFSSTHAGLAENNIVERACVSFELQPVGGGDPANGDDHRFLGNISIAANIGFHLQSRCGGANPCTDRSRVAENNLYEHNVAVSGERGFYLRGGVGTRVRSSSAFDGMFGFLSDRNSGENSGLAGVGAEVDSSLAADGVDGFVMLDGIGWSVVRSNASVTGNAFTPNDSRVMASTTIAPGLGSCRTYVPATSPLKGAGTGGADIGANVISRYLDGVSTAERLWSPSGAFPCGATVAGINDDPLGGSTATEACINVHRRLGFTSGCPVP